MTYATDPYIVELRAAYRAGASITRLARIMGMTWGTVKRLIDGTP